MTTTLRRILLLLAVLLGTSVAASAQVTVTGHILNPDGTPAKNAKACVSLQGYKPQAAKVLASGTLVNTSTFCVPTSSVDGSFSTTLFPNYAITPPQTFWRVDYMVGGVVQSSATYNVNLNPFNLDNATPTVSFPSPSTFVLGAKTFEFTQGTPATTWTIHHAFGDKNVVQNCYDTNNKFLIPDTVVETDLNTLTITFTSPQAGNCTVMTGGNVALTNAPANAVITNPSATQVINGAPLTIQTPFNAQGGGTLSQPFLISNAYNINNIIAVDGVKYATLAAAAADPVCASSNGCTIDMRGNSSPTALALGSFDPGSTPMTVLLGPYTYTTSGITLRASFHLQGVAAGGATASSTGTFINPTSTSVPIIKMPATSTLGIADVQLSNFRINCAPGNTNQVGINITAPQGSGLWYSTFSNIQVEGCMGEGILLDGSAGGSPVAINQFLEFHTVIVIRPANAAPSIHMRGVNGQFIFTNCLFDAAAQYGGTHDNLPNVVVEDSAVAGIVAPYSIAMYQTTVQGGGIAIKLRGSQSFSCDNCHFEHDWGILNVGIGTQFGSPSNSITNSTIYTSGVSSPAGSGYLITMDSGSQIAFNNNAAFGTPDNFYLGTLTHLTAGGLFNSSDGQAFPAGASSLRIPEGIFGDSSGFKAANVSTGTISGGARVSVTVPWTTAFPDTAYIPLCFLADFNPASNAQGLVAERVNSQSASQIQVTVFNPTGSSDTGNLGCIAVHQ